MSNKTLKAVLSEKELPRQWYNLAADLPKGMNPPLAPTASRSNRKCWRRCFR